MWVWGICRSQSKILVYFPPWIWVFIVLRSMNVLSGHQRMDQEAFLLQDLWSGQKGKVSSWCNLAWQNVQIHWLNFLVVLVIFWKLHAHIDYLSCTSNSLTGCFCRDIKIKYLEIFLRITHKTHHCFWRKCYSASVFLVKINKDFTSLPVNVMFSISIKFTWKYCSFLES